MYGEKNLFPVKRALLCIGRCSLRGRDLRRFAWMKLALDSIRGEGCEKWVRRISKSESEDSIGTNMSEVLACLRWKREAF